MGPAICFLVVMMVAVMVPAGAAPVRVAVYTDGGAMEPYITAAADVATSAGMTVERVKAADIVAGALARADVIVFPGGTGNGQARSLGESGAAAVVEFVAGGGGAIGICAGGYLLAEGYNADTRRIELINARLFDLDHWARGTARVGIQPLGPGAPAGEIAIHFENAPIFEPGGLGERLPAYTALARFTTDPAGTPADRPSIVGQDAIIAAPHGRGRVVLFGPHPELTSGLAPLLVGALRWAAGHGPADPDWNTVLALAEP
jgi:glutamine amidotransferase-like uncharacterized protein